MCSPPGSGGSPPRVWGMHLVRLGQGVPERFTPTCVGNAGDGERRHRFRPVHPHVCGECPCDVGAMPATPGSPPRVWGMRSAARCPLMILRFTPTCAGNAADVYGNEDAQGGSPPRVWGMPIAGAPCRHVARFTPTCVGNAPTSTCSGIRIPVHPHVCGECSQSWPFAHRKYGSPPRVWGMRAGEPVQERRGRFTPTCVGNASGPRCRSSPRAVHPHVCGECELPPGRVVALNGSPPRVWGMRRRQHGGRRCNGFTPTCVGNATTPSPPPPTAAVHPHVCGECVCRTARSASACGSPPRVWGMLPQVNVPRAAGRFTPTCVGNARTASTSEGWPTVHPHVCGECQSEQAPSRASVGSPPRVWGMRQEAPLVGRGGRFTPTCVGNAPVAPSFTNRVAVHPHVCGECLFVSTAQAGHYGSPPRVWGMRVSRSCSILRSRFTPTCVGNAPRPPPPCSTPPVHPHVCGECAVPEVVFTPRLGSPPRVWGMRGRDDAEADGVRFTPTCVGNARRTCSPPPPCAVHPHVCGECGADIEA